MRKFTFMCEEGYNKTSIEFNAYDFYDVLTKFNQFIKAAGYAKNVVNESTKLPEMQTGAVTYHNGLTVSHLINSDLTAKDQEIGQWKDYKFDTSKMDHLNSLTTQSYPTMAPLTSEQIYSWSVNPIQQLTTVDLKALTSASLPTLKPEDITGLNYKFNL